MELMRRLDDDALYSQFLRRDPAFDGKFLTGVLTTGIYCLPSCPARRPKRENVRFFQTPEEARASGLRACHRCRPDWFYRGEEWSENLFEQTAARVRNDPARFREIGDIARAAGLSGTALNTLFREHAHESPAEFLRRVRVERVCRLLREGARPSDAADLAGFESPSAFHHQFSARTGLTPGAYAGLGPEFTLRLPTGYRIREIAAFHGRDPQGASGFAARFEGASAVWRGDHDAAVRMLGFDSDAPAFERRFGDDPLLGPAILRRRGLRIPLTATPWEALAWAIIGQQINLTFAISLRRALIDLAGGEAFPTAERVAEMSVDALRAVRFSGSKAEYVIGAARAVASGETPVDRMREVSARRAARLLGAVRGVGPWTVQYTMLRGLGFADCLPAGDAGLAQGLERMLGKRPGEAEIRELMATYAPWRSLATCHVWASLDGES